MACAVDLIPDSALLVAYLRRLGFRDDQSANYASSKPLSGGSAKTLLSELLCRHVLRIPFSTLERLSCDEDKRASLSGDVRQLVARVALGLGGGDCFDLNAAFAWLLKQLGATAKLCLATDAAAEGFSTQATRSMVLVDIQGDVLLLDPAAQDAPRALISLSNGTVDDSFDVCASEGAPDGFDKTLNRRKGSGDDVERVAVCAFRSADDLALDSQELCAALQAALAAEDGVFAEKRITLATPKGKTLLGSRSMQRWENNALVEEVPVDNDEHFKRLAGELFATPLLKPPPVEVPKAAPVKASAPAWARRQTAPPAGISDQMAKSQMSFANAASKSQGFGNVDSKSLAIGGAGQGGGLGLNAPGFGPKVQHFMGGGGGGGASKAAIEVSDEIRLAWTQVQEDSNPLSWVFCEYSADGRSLELKCKGDGGLSDFKKELGDTIAWGGLRCYGVDKRGGLECKRPKFIFVQYKPDSASGIKKAKQASHKGAVKDALNGAHLDVSVESLADLDEQGLIEKLQAATGAHKPNGYEFDTGVFLEADYYGLGIGRDCKAETSRS